MDELVRKLEEIAGLLRKIESHLNMIECNTRKPKPPEIRFYAASLTGEPLRGEELRALMGRGP